MGKDKPVEAGVSVGKVGQRLVYQRPRILSVMLAPDITKSMQNTGGTVARSTFRSYRLQGAQTGRS